MNKQEAIEKIEELKKLSCGALGYDWISLGIDKALNVVKQLDEPEKTVLTKEEAEWVDKLTDFYSLPDALYYITRCGYGYLFTFTMANKTYELPVDSGATYGEFCKLKERLVNAVLYGYEVKKEKLYTVKFSNEDFGKIYIGIMRSANKLGYSTLPIDDKYSKCHFTESELKELKFWDNPAFEIEEVK
nr:DUF1642 domain-containing protein [Streptococcus lutetiensis]